jgi:hypothetical protein
MKQLCLCLLSAAAVPALVAASLPAGEITFAPAEGLSLARKFTSHAQLSLGDMSMSMNGQPMPMEIKMEMDMDTTTEVEVTDQFVAMGSGQPRKLQRTFDAIGQAGSFAMEMEMMPDGGQEMDITASSELEGKSVTFEWDEEAEEFEVAWHESEGDDELLEGLTEDMDLRALLPAGAVAEGDTWDLDVKKLRTVLALGGNMKIVPKTEGMPEGGMPGMDGMTDFSQMFDDLIEGDATAEYRGTRDVDGVSCGVIGIKVDVRASADLTEQLEESVSQSLPDGMGEVEVEHVDMDLEIEGEGQLYWDPAAGLAHSFEMTGKMTIHMDMAFAISMGEQDMTMEQNLTMSGTFEDKLAVAKN